jgi:hypothetical protein
MLDTVMAVKWQFERSCQYASGDLIRPAHNRLYLRVIIGHTQPAVPLGCGQLGSGSDAVGTARHARSQMPTAQLFRQQFRRHPCAIRRIEGLSFRDHRPREVQQLARCCAACYLRRFASCAEALVVCFDNGIEACGR